MSEKVRILVKTLAHFDPELGLPFYATIGAAGSDIKASLHDKKSIFIKPGERVLIPSGLSFEIPEGFEVQVRPRSGLSLKSSLMIANAPGTIDCDYRGEVMVIVANFGNDIYEVTHGLRIAQLVVCPVWQGDFKLANDLSDTVRGSGGFGSTGTK
jgi:dUTP pyrophosphatase